MKAFKRGVLARHLSGKSLMILLTLGPLLLYAVAFWIFPMLFTLVVSFTDWSPVYQGSGFVGFDNFKRFLTPRGLRPIGNALYFAGGSVSLKMIIGFGLALMLNSIPRLRSVFRTIYFLPVVTPIVAVAVIWRWLYQPQFGLINQILELFMPAIGLEFTRLRWLSDTQLAMPSVIIMEIWRDVGYSMVLFLAGLQGIPESYYEAARVDGATWWQEIFYITLPLIAPTTLFVLVTGTIGAMQAFTQIYIMTQGGPMGATRTIVYDIFVTAFRDFKFGYASAMTMGLFILILIISLIQIQVVRNRWEY